jgi:UDP-N-acetylglucosamine 2-epimerase (hydrolysing)
MSDSDPRSVVFLTGTRAEYSKLKTLIRSVNESLDFECYVFVTGMHMLDKYGSTHREIAEEPVEHVYRYINQRENAEMDLTLAETVRGFSNYVNEVGPDLIVTPTDRIESLAAAVVGSFNNFLVAHLEGGEVSGTVDEGIRHAVTKLSHVHFVANEEAKRRVMQLGESEATVRVIGSPDIDVMLSEELLPIEIVKEQYEIPFESYGILIYHPVTTEIDEIPDYAEAVVDAVIESGRNFVVIHPNNDAGSEYILEAYDRFKGCETVRAFPSIPFESFLSLLEHSEFIMGNSSAGIREAGVYGVPAIDIGNRQQGRHERPSLFDVGHDIGTICAAIRRAEEMEVDPCYHFGDGHASERFLTSLRDERFWEIPLQKHFVDRFDLESVDVIASNGG